MPLSIESSSCPHNRPSIAILFIGTAKMPHIDDYILDTLLRDLTGHDHKPASFLVYLWLTGEQARRTEPVAISYAELAESTGLSRSAAQASVAWLKGRKLLAVAKENATAVPVYTVLQPWRRSKAAR
jgi:hypothetical protein